MQFLTWTLLSALASLAVGAPSSLVCNQNNCLRAYLHTTSLAYDFCSTYIESTVTVTMTQTLTSTGMTTIPVTPFPTLTAATIPPHISSRCVDTDVDSTTIAYRLSSACSCITATPATVTTTVAAAATATAYCGVRGYLSNESQFILDTTDAADLSPAGCAEDCFATPNCNLFFVGVPSDPFCELQGPGSVASTGFSGNPGSFYFGFDLACFPHP